MALMNNQTFGLTKWWLTCALDIVQVDRETFRSTKMREARKRFIAGTNAVKAIREWLLATQIIKKSPENGQYELTNLGRSIKQNDKNLEGSSAWWAIHLAICFPERNNGATTKDEPYVSLFNCLDSIGKSWISCDELEHQIFAKLSKEYARGSVEPALEGVFNMFNTDQPLADIGLLEIQGKFKNIRLGSPIVSDEVIVHALAMARSSLFPTRTTIDFMELIKNNVHAYLCLTPEEFRNRIRRLSNSDNWKKYLTYSENANLNSIFFSENLRSIETILILLQANKNAWE